MKIISIISTLLLFLNAQTYEIGSRLSVDHQLTEIYACANDSGPVSLADYNGNLNGGNFHIILLNFFTSWCTNCQAETPLLFGLNEQYRDQGLTLLSLGRQWDYPYSCQGWADLGLYNPVLDDDTTSVWSWFGLGYVPQQVILDHNMNVRYNDYGFDAAEISYVIETLISEMQTVSIEDEYIADRFEITPPYPNPFNSQFTWKLNLQKETYVEANIIDLSGRVVDTITEKTLPRGSYTFTKSMDHISSGIYFLDVATPFYRKTHKMVFLK